eukprot:scaffold22.g6064.t1
METDSGDEEVYSASSEEEEDDDAPASSSGASGSEGGRAKRPLDAGAAKPPRKRRCQTFRKIRPEERCGACINCLNPQRKKACIVARERLEREQQGANGDGGSKKAAAPAAAAAPAPTTNASGGGGGEDTFVRALRPILAANGGVAQARHAPMLLDLLRRAGGVVHRNTLLTVLGQSGAEVLGAAARGGALRVLEAWLSDFIADAKPKLVAKVLSTLEGVPVTRAELEPPCRIGKVVGKLRKNEAFEPGVRAAAGRLVAKWVAQVEREAAAADKAGGGGGEAKPPPAAAARPAVSVAAKPPGAAPAAKPAVPKAQGQAAGAGAPRPLERQPSGGGAARAPERHPSGALMADDADMFRASDASKRPAKEAPVVVRKVIKPAEVPAGVPKAAPATPAAHPPASAPAPGAARPAAAANPALSPLDSVVGFAGGVTMLGGGGGGAVALARVGPTVLTAAQRAAEAARRVPSPEPRPRKEKRKRVSWRGETELEAVRLFLQADPPAAAKVDADLTAPPQPDQAPRKRSPPGFEVAARKEHRSEAEALRQHRQQEVEERTELQHRLAELVATVAWHAPRLLAAVLQADALPEGNRPGRGEESTEAPAAAARRAQGPPATYYSRAELPDCPTEPLSLEDYGTAQHPAQIPHVPLSVEQAQQWAAAAAQQQAAAQAQAAVAAAAAQAARTAQAAAAAAAAQVAQQGLQAGGGYPAAGYRPAPFVHAQQPQPHYPPAPAPQPMMRQTPAPAASAPAPAAPSGASGGLDLHATLAQLAASGLFNPASLQAAAPTAAPQQQQLAPMQAAAPHLQHGALPPMQRAASQQPYAPAYAPPSQQQQQQGYAPPQQQQAYAPPPHHPAQQQQQGFPPQPPLPLYQQQPQQQQYAPLRLQQQQQQQQQYAPLRLQQQQQQQQSIQQQSIQPHQQQQQSIQPPPPPRQQRQQQQQRAPPPRQHPAPGAAGPRAAAQQAPLCRSSTPCRHFNTPSGCFKGDKCRFAHVQPEPALVLINISDHWTRTKANAGGGGEASGTRVLGCLLGQQVGRAVDISNSFEMRLGGEGDLDVAFLHKKMEQYKQTFPMLDVITEINESPVFLRLDPAIDPSHKDLPLQLYESELHVVGGAPTFIFAHSKFTIQTSEAERIGVDQVAKILPTGAASGTSQLSAHLTSMHSAVTMLVSRVAILHKMLLMMQSGEVPFDHGLVRQAAGLINRLPAIDSPQFADGALAEHNDTLLTILLSTLTKGAATCNELVEKCNVAYDRSSMKRVPKGMAGVPTHMLLNPARRAPDVGAEMVQTRAQQRAQRPTHLLDLPDSCLEPVLALLPFSDISNCQLACRRLRDMARQPSSQLWGQVSVRRVELEPAELAPAALARLGGFVCWLRPRAGGVRTLELDILLSAQTAKPLEAAAWRLVSRALALVAPGLEVLRLLWATRLVPGACVAAMPHLREADFVAGKIELGPELAQAKALRDLWCLDLTQNDSLTPDAYAPLAQLPRLQELCASWAQLTALPPALSALSDLRVLYLHSNFAAGPPPGEEDWAAALGPMTGLGMLSLSACRLEAVPTAVAAMTALRCLHVEDNPGIRVVPGAYLQGLVELSLDWTTLAVHHAVLRGAAALTKLFACGHHTGDAGAPPPAPEPLAVWPAPAVLDSLAALPRLESFVDVLPHVRTSYLLGPIAALMYQLPRRLPELQIDVFVSENYGWRLADVLELERKEGRAQDA